MTTLTVNISDKKTEKAVKAVLDALGLSYAIGKDNEASQSLEQYNLDLENGNTEIEQGYFVTAQDLLKESQKW